VGGEHGPGRRIEDRPPARAARRRAPRAGPGRRARLDRQQLAARNDFDDRASSASLRVRRRALALDEQHSTRPPVARRPEPRRMTRESFTTSSAPRATARQVHDPVMGDRAAAPLEEHQRPRRAPAAGAGRSARGGGGSRNRRRASWRHGTEGEKGERGKEGKRERGKEGKRERGKGKQATGNRQQATGK